MAEDFMGKLSGEQKEQAVTMYAAGLACGPIAEYFGVTRQAMWDILHRHTTMRHRERHGEDNHFYRGNDDHAQNMVEYAIRAGALTPKDACEACGERRGIQAHHDDYNKPLDVRWLCQRCHHEWHRHNVAKRKGVVPQEASGGVDLLVGGFP